MTNFLESEKMKKKQVIIIGATGAAGQNIVEFTMDHPWFEICCLSASERSRGKAYHESIKEAVFFDRTPSEEILDMKVESAEKVDPRDYDVAFSALPTDVAKIQEAQFAKHIPVISTASAYRYQNDVPILIPEANPQHVELLKKQRNDRGWRGYIAPGPNCTTVGLAMTLKPIHDLFKVEKVSMVSMQALSGAGEKGLRQDSDYRKSAIKNVLPFIEGEEEKVERETNKILGTLKSGEIEPAGINIHATCTRVFVETVHTEAVHLGTKSPHSLQEIKKALNGFRSEPQELRLPSAPEQPIIVVEEPDEPQPSHHKTHPDMVTIVGRLRENTLFNNGLSYVLTSDNLERGAGGGAVITAEFLMKKGLL